MTPAKAGSIIGYAMRPNLVPIHVLPEGLNIGCTLCWSEVYSVGMFPHVHGKNDVGAPARWPYSWSLTQMVWKVAVSLSSNQQDPTNAAHKAGGRDLVLPGVE